MQTLTDEIPFADTKSEPQLIIAIVQGRSPSDTSSLSSYAKELRVLLADCWNRQPNKRPTAVDCLRIVECAIPTPEQKTVSTAKSPSPSLSSPFVPCTEVPARTITNGGFNSPNGTNLSVAIRRHNLNLPWHRPPGVISPRNGALQNQLQQRYAIQVEQTRQLNQNGVSNFFVCSVPFRRELVTQVAPALTLSLKGAFFIPYKRLYWLFFMVSSGLHAWGLFTITFSVRCSCNPSTFYWIFVICLTHVSLIITPILYSPGRV